MIVLVAAGGVAAVHEQGHDMAEAATATAPSDGVAIGTPRSAAQARAEADRRLDSLKVPKGFSSLSGPATITEFHQDLFLRATRSVHSTMNVADAARLFDALQEPGFPMTTAASVFASRSYKQWNGSADIATAEIVAVPAGGVTVQMTVQVFWVPPRAVIPAGVGSADVTLPLPSGKQAHVTLGQSAARALATRINHLSVDTVGGGSDFAQTCEVTPKEVVFVDHGDRYTFRTSSLGCGSAYSDVVAIELNDVGATLLDDYGGAITRSLKDLTPP